MLLFLDFPEETRKLPGPGALAEGALTGTYSTRPSSTTLEILTPDRDAESSDDSRFTQFCMSGLLYRMDRKSDFLTSFEIKSLYQFLLEVMVVMN